VVHGKGSLLGKMPGDEWQRFANLRVLLGTMFAQPGKKLLFMGGDIAQWDEWRHDAAVQWHLLDYPRHAGLQHWVGALNRAYVGEPALHEQDHDPLGFEWVDVHDANTSVISFLRKAKDPDDCVLVACNFTPVPRHNYLVGCPRGGFWRELLNSDALEHGGSGQGNLGGVEANPITIHGRPWSLNLTLPPLAVVYLRPEGPA
jgi:1,4-alpha-glucan branching enzyme